MAERIVIEEYDPEDELAKLRSQLAALEVSLANKSVAMDNARIGREALVAEEAELQRKLSEARERRRSFDSSYTEIQRERTREQKTRDAINLQLQEMLKEKAIRDEFEKMVAFLDRDTKNCEWYPHAYPHQKDGAQRLAIARRAILGDKRGLGKTLTSLAWLDMIHAKKTLIVCPLDVTKNYEREVKRWTPSRGVLVMSRLPKGQRDVMLTTMRQVNEITIIFNYDAWVKDDQLVRLLINMQFDTVIIDEAHNIKNPKSKAFRGLKDIVYADNKCPICDHNGFHTVQNGFSYNLACRECGYERDNESDFCSVQYVLPMTGTAILNRPEDIWPLLYLVDRDSFRSRSAFIDQYASKSGGRSYFKAGGQKLLLQKLGMRYIGRNEKTTGVTFPKQDVIMHDIEFDQASYPEQFRILRQIDQFSAIKMSDSDVLEINSILPELTRKRQAITWPPGIEMKDSETGETLYRADAHESIKLDKAQELIESIVNEEGERVVVFCTFTQALKEMERRLNDAGISCVRYDGSITDANAERVQLDFDIKTCDTHPFGEEHDRTCFNDSGERICKGGYRWKVILAQYQKASTGINLTGARHMILVDRFFSPGREDQAMGRIQRLDSKYESFVHILNVPGSVDDWMNELIEYKSNEIEGFETNNDINEINAKFRQMMIDGKLL